MAQTVPISTKKFNTELTDYSKQHSQTSGPYADNQDVDALIVGAGFGLYFVPSYPSQLSAHSADILAFMCSWHLHAEDSARSRVQGSHL